jgi:hypothetical protein
LVLIDFLLAWQPSAHLCLQLAVAWGAKVMATITTSEEFNYLQDLNIAICRWLRQAARFDLIPGR